MFIPRSSGVPRTDLKTWMQSRSSITELQMFPLFTILLYAYSSLILYSPFIAFYTVWPAHVPGQTPVWYRAPVSFLPNERDDFMLLLAKCMVTWAVPIVPYTLICLEMLARAPTAFSAWTEITKRWTKEIPRTLTLGWHWDQPVSQRTLCNTFMLVPTLTKLKVL